MGGKKNSLGLFIWIGFLFCMGILGTKMVAFAGEINENEAGVIAAASGTFTYDGKTYRADSAYLNSLTSYLAGDSVDLTAEQASRAISMMYENIANGVEKGYLYEVGDSRTEPATEAVTGTSEQPDTNSGEKGTEEATEEGTGPKKEETDGQPEDEKGTQNGKPSELDVWEAMSNPTEAKEKLEKRPEKEDAAASVKLDENDIVITTKNNETINISKKEQLVSDRTLLVMDGISGIILAITLICGIILFITKCIVFKRPKSRRARPGHSKRRKIRRYTRNTLTVTTAVSIAAVFVLLGSYISLFNQNTIMQNMQSSGYFRYAYSEYISGMVEEAAANVAEDGALTDMGEIVSYEDYLFAIKQNSAKILDGETDIKVPDSNVAPYIYNIKRSYMQMFRIAGIFTILSMVLGIILMIFMDQRRDRGVKHIAVAELAASGVMVLVTVIMVAAKPYQNLYIEPDYLYLFIMECVNWGTKVMTSIVAFGVVLGMILIGVYKTMTNHHSE